MQHDAYLDFLLNRVEVLIQRGKENYSTFYLTEAAKELEWIVKNIKWREEEELKQLAAR